MRRRALEEMSCAKEADKTYVKALVMIHNRFGRDQTQFALNLFNPIATFVRVNVRCVTNTSESKASTLSR